MVAQLPGLAGDKATAAALSKRRLQIGQRLWPAFCPPACDEPAARLAVAVHNLLALGHPAMMGASARARDTVIGFSVDLASLGPPPTVIAALERHSMLSRVGEIERNEHEVQSWLGTQSFVGQTPPPRLLRWRKLRRVQVLHQRRNWMRDIGVPNDARRLWQALAEANPLMEALDPARLDPSVSWEHLFEVLRFAPLARAVAVHLVGQGLATAAEPLATALFVHAALKESSRPTASHASVAFGVAFLAHVFWLHTTMGAPGEPGPALTALLAAAADEPQLILPADVRASPFTASLVEQFAARLKALRVRSQLHPAFVREAAATVAQAKKTDQLLYS